MGPISEANMVWDEGMDRILWIRMRIRMSIMMSMSMSMSMT